MRLHQFEYTQELDSELFCHPPYRLGYGLHITFRERPFLPTRHWSQKEVRLMHLSERLYLSTLGPTRQCGFARLCRGQAWAERGELAKRTAVHGLPHRFHTHQLRFTPGRGLWSQDGGERILSGIWNWGETWHHW